jgi:DNA polymerase elongation subunit (family B)
MAPVVFDVECYRNFFLVLFKDIATGAVTRCQISPNRSLNRALLLHTVQTSLLVGFNSAEYDVPMIQMALKGYSTSALKDASDDIILRGMRGRELGEKHDISKPSWNHIDLIQVAPLKASLKLYAGRLHCKKLQDLPFDPESDITAEQAAIIVDYCGNDLNNTATLYAELDTQIRLREELSRIYRQDLRSRSDAQVAEHIISAEVEKINGVRPQRPDNLEGKTYKYRVPEYISYRLPQLQGLLETIKQADFTVGAKGSVELPKALEALDIRIGGGKYRIGIGGLHSSESCAAHVADEDVLLIDRDVTSYYPAIILNQGLYPQHLGEAFLTVYRSLVERRVAAKKAGDKVTAESLKIAVNGSYGKLGNKWSTLYAPDLLIQVTMTGQLALLLLIEMIEEYGIRVVSANTDGVLIRCRKWRAPLLNEVIGKWEALTGFGTEESQYRAVYAKDVNNYIAIKADGKVKGKGLYSCPWNGVTEGPPVFKLQKNPSTTIVIEAVIALLRDGTPLEDTIRNCTDITKFVAVRTVTGGASQNGVYIGKVVRWYYSRDSGQSVINYRKSGYKVPKSDDSKPLMELPDAFPSDVNYDWYIAEARNVLNNIGYGQRTLFGS